MPTPKRYRPCCLECYTTHLTPEPVSKREAERIAVSHMNAYRHKTTILAVEPESKKAE